MKLNENRNRVIKPRLQDYIAILPLSSKHLSYLPFQNAIMMTTMTDGAAVVDDNDDEDAFIIYLWQMHR